MNRQQELDQFHRLQVLAENDIVLATVLRSMRAGLLTRQEAFMAGLETYAHTVKSLRAQLLDAESRRPRIYYLGPA